VLLDYLRAIDAGQAPERGELLRRHPDLADDLRAYFADQDRIERLAQPIHHELPGEPPTGVLDTVRFFGEYELLNELARGSMSVLYKARQVSLNRLVALKMIRDKELTSPEDVDRFRREAEAAASLDHPNIVPIYEVGEHQGQQYYSMKLIEGGSLG